MGQVNIVTVVQTGLWQTEHAHADTVMLYNCVNMTSNFHQRRALQLWRGIGVNNGVSSCQSPEDDYPKQYERFTTVSRDIVVLVFIIRTIVVI